jgi:hypothetical protein
MSRQCAYRFTLGIVTLGLWSCRNSFVFASVANDHETLIGVPARAVRAIGGVTGLAIGIAAVGVGHIGAAGTLAETEAIPMSDLPSSLQLQAEHTTGALTQLGMADEVELVVSRGDYDVIDHQIKQVIGSKHAIVVSGFSGLGYENLALEVAVAEVKEALSREIDTYIYPEFAPNPAKVQARVEKSGPFNPTLLRDIKLDEST